MLDDPAFTTRMVSTLGYLSPEVRAAGLLLSASVAMRDNLLALVQICGRPPLTSKERATAGAAAPRRVGGHIYLRVIAADSEGETLIQEPQSAQATVERGDVI